MDTATLGSLFNPKVPSIETVTIISPAAQDKVRAGGLGGKITGWVAMGKVVLSVIALGGKGAFLCTHP